MQLHTPFEISARLMASIRISGASISIGYLSTSNDGRDVYDIWIDLPGGKEFHVTDMKSGCQGGTLQEGMGSLLCFLGAAAESRAYRERSGRPGENEDLFEADLVEWAAENSDEISMMQIEIEETADLIIE